MGGAYSTDWKEERRVQGLVGKPERKRLRHGREDNIKMDLQEVGFRDMDWIKLAQDRDRWHCDKNYVSIKCGKFLD
jgi:hypothetical protein